MGKYLKLIFVDFFIEKDNDKVRISNPIDMLDSKIYSKIEFIKYEE